MQLDIEVSMKGNCSIKALDYTTYTEELNAQYPTHVFIEYVCYKAYDDLADLAVIPKSLKVTEFITNDLLSEYVRTYDYSITKDGRYRYYKFVVDTLRHPSVDFGDGYFHIKDKVIYYNDKLYLGTSNAPNTVTSLAGYATEITDYYQLNNHVDILDYYYVTEIFSLCLLRKCVVNFQREVLYESLRNCNLAPCIKNNSSVNRTERDFLFVALFILENLIGVGNFDEAQRIFEQLENCNNLLCGSYSNTSCCG